MWQRLVVHSSGWNSDYCKAGVPRLSSHTNDTGDPLMEYLVCPWEIVKIKAVVNKMLIA